MEYIYYICFVDNKKIKLARIEKGLSQQELADKAKVSRQTIVAIEKGNYSPSLELAFRIARVFNLTVEDVFQYTEQRPAPRHA